MALKVGELYGVIDLDRAPFNRGLSQAHQDFRLFGVNMAGLAVRVAGGMAIAFAIYGAGRVVKSIAEMGIAYQDTMNMLQAVTGATGAQMASLGKTAQDLGNDLELPNVSAADAARAMVELAKAGLSVIDTQRAAKGVLELATAADIDAGQAAQITATALNAFHLEGDKAIQVADLLAAAAHSAAGDIPQMADALQMSAAVFAAAKVPIQDVVTLIAELANNGIIGSDAGTSLKQMLLQLQTPSKQQTDILKSLNFSLYDAQGHMKSMRDIIGGLADAESKLTPQQRDYINGVLFGSDAVRAANILLSQGVEGFDKMYGAVTKTGAAHDLAAARSKGLGGALRGLQSQIETISLGLYQQFAPGLEAGVRGVSTFIDGLQKGKDPAAALYDALGQMGIKGEALSQIMDIMRPIIANVQDLWRQFAGWLQVAWPVIQAVALQLWQVLAPALQIIADNSDQLSAVLRGLLIAFGLLALTIAGAIVTFAYAVAAVLLLIRWVENLGTAIVQNVTRMVMAWAAFLSSVTNAVVGAGAQLQSLVGTAFGVVSGIASAFFSLPGRIGQAIGNLWSMGRNAIDNFVSGFMSRGIPTPHLYWRGPTDAGGIAQAILSGAALGDIGVSWYQRGGVFGPFAPMLAGLGEGSSREVLAPEPVLLSMFDRFATRIERALARDGGGGREVIFNNYATVNERKLASELALATLR